MRRFLLAVLLALIFGTSMSFPQVNIRIGPPPNRVEGRPKSPGARYVWVPGYQRWDGRRYMWERGRWVLPPRSGARWAAGHWDRRQGGWAWTAGQWR